MSATLHVPTVPPAAATTTATAIQFHDDNLLAVDTSDQENLLVTGTVQGEVCFHRFTPPEPTLCVSSLNTFKDSCRCLRFSKSGKLVYCGSKDKSLVAIDVETRKRIKTHNDAHESPLNALHCVSERLISTGDENGCIKVWDTRAQREVLSLKENTDFISNMASKDSTLLCTSGDGSLTVVDLRKKALSAKSDNSESELLCLSLVKDGTRVVTGNGEGVLGIFIWDLWGDIVERHPILPSSDSIDSLVQISDSVVCAGGMDGKLRAVQIFPNKTIGEIGLHSSDYSVDGLRLTHDKRYVVSSSYDAVKFWRTDEIPSMWIDSEKEEDSSEEEGKAESSRYRRKKRKKKNRKQLLQPKKTKSVDQNFFSDL